MHLAAVTTITYTACIAHQSVLVPRPTTHARDSTALGLIGHKIPTMHTRSVTDRAAHTGPFVAHLLFTSQKHVQDVRPRIALKTDLRVNCSVDEEMTLGAGPGGDCVCASTRRDVKVPDSNQSLTPLASLINPC
jgi:hypothetical protein